MISYIEKKHLATIEALEAYGSAIRAYYHDPSEPNRMAYQACKNALEKMLEPYYMHNHDVSPVAHAAETET